MAESTHTKHRISKIDQLPDELKSQLNMLLRDGKMSQEKIRTLVNVEIDQQGLADEPEYIKRNAMSRYAQTFRKGMERYEQAQQLTNQWVGQFGEMPQTDISRALIEIGKSQVFDFQMKALEEDKTIDPKTMGQLALAIKRLQEAQSGSVKLQQEVRKQAIEDAADKAEAVAQKAGMSSETVKMLKDELLGIN
ncbi:DUF3486 family protein [Vibrio splendidus]|jgi:HD-GYP domain-containing protein (c-di-GMP phosphodiesterase class II)|uniref:DUF3486 family protein n=1 Tax=Vibrio splendidus TaxID=29497 RepID=UPI000D364E8A|nr:DUF3486 family protein [Vibrio splendidus]PTP90102.1 hypothetical protein CWO03_05055 [Vibrio splendidus]